MARSVCESLSSFLVMDILGRAQELERSGNRVIHLEIGQPDFASPACVNEAAIKAIKDGQTGYTHSTGILPLREAISEYYAKEYGSAVDPEHIIVTDGTSPAMMMLFSVLCEPGDNVIIADPSYACYENFIRFAGAEARRLDTVEANGFQLSPEIVRRAVTPRTRAVLVNSPSNPTGSLFTRQDMEALAGIRPMPVSADTSHGCHL